MKAFPFPAQEPKETMDQKLANAKKELRSVIRSRLKTLQINRVGAAMKLYERLISLPRVRQAKTIGVFIDFGTEIPTRYFIPKLFEGNGFTRDVGIPFCVDGEMNFYRLERPDVEPETNEPVFHDLTPMTFGILEPTPERRSKPQNLLRPECFDVMITPGLAFDLQGRRLGRGAGFYDRYLPRLRSDALIVGIGYEEQIVEEAPVGELDHMIHALVTPDRAVIFE